ncbi:MAG: HDOD domain-containing protein [Gammaproteobacteria bacterium]|nr:HDOD domain-containing protein [Gammaproteobacteria bacterium]
MSEKDLQSRVEDALRTELPILPETLAHIEALRARDDMAMREIGQELLLDPGMALKLLQTANAHRQRHFHEDVVDLDKTVMLLGLERVVGMARELPTIAAPMDTHVQTQLRRLYARSWLASLLCEDWARHRHDIAPQEVALAGLFSHIGGITLWLQSSGQMMQLEALRQTPGATPEEAEYVVFGGSIECFGHALAGAYGLPRLVVESLSSRYAQESRTLGVMLAAQVAYQATHGWQAPHCRALLDMARQYLDLPWEAFVESTNRILAGFNQRAGHYGIRPLALLEDEPPAVGTGHKAPVAFCLAPRGDRLASVVATLSRGEGEPGTYLAQALELMRDALGLNRLFFARRLADGTLAPEALVGTDYEPDFNHLRFSPEPANLFSALMQKPSAVWVNEDNARKYWGHVPTALRALLDGPSFMAMSVFVDGEPYGLLYADRRNPACRLDARSFDTFKRLVSMLARRLEQLLPADRRPFAD